MVFVVVREGGIETEVVGLVRWMLHCSIIFAPFANMFIIHIFV